MLPVAALLAIVVGTIAAGLWLTLPPHGETLTIAGLSAPVEITLDDDGVPRVRAGSAEDAAAALGYLHARDRMFQMEMMRRAASGRLSELLGSSTLPFDRSMRVLGLRVRAEEDWASLPAEPRRLLNAYAAGVNAWITARGRYAAPELLVLGAPEPWSPVDSMLWGKTMALFLSGNYRTELARAGLLAKLPAAEIEALWPQPAGTPAPEAALHASRLAELLPHFPDPFSLPGSASDEWALDGRYTASGAPLLAGDPHLSFTLPGIWYLARIDTPGGVLAGATAPGVPLIVLGHNGHVAWTFTTTGADTQDVFIETVLPDGRYATPDGPAEFSVRDERIGVRFGTGEVLHVRSTRHGPVVSDLDFAAGPVMALQAANLMPGDTAVQGLLALNQASSVAEAGRAAAMISSPVQNLLVADRTGIAMFTTGRVPVRRAGDGELPVLGADGAHDWTGFASGLDLPHVVAPASGRLVNGNERTAPADFPVFMGADWTAPWRAERIRARLAARDKHDAASFASIQVDDTSVFAQRVLPRLRQTPVDDSTRAGLRLLDGWDGAMTVDAPQPLLFNAWMDRFDALLTERRAVPARLTGPEADLIGHVLLDGGDEPWCANNCAPLLHAALFDAMERLSAAYGPDPAKWRWGAAHRVRFAHPILDAVPVVRDWAGIELEQPGDDTTPFRGGPRADFTSVHGAGYRGVYDLADLDQSLFIATPGQSGHLLSRHATDMAVRWRDGRTIVIGPAPSHVEDTIRLMP